MMTYRDSATEDDINRDVLHGFRVEASLKFGRHETIAVSGIDEANEVDGEHEHVEGYGNAYQTEGASEEVFEPDSLFELV